jgi:Lon protease-like protein
MCRRSLAEMLTWLNLRARMASFQTGDNWSHGGRQISVTTQIEALLQTHFTEEATASRDRHAAGEASDGPDRTTNIAIFCCSVSLPGVKTGLHVFEPRYRLMMRRCIESGQKKFGMCRTSNSEYGTILRILDYEQLPDGRSRIEAVGEERFRVVEWGERDGYSTGRVQWIEDEPRGLLAYTDNPYYPRAVATDPEEEEAEERQRAETIRAQIRRVLPQRAIAHLEGMFGSLPEAPHDNEVVFWVAAVLQGLGVMPEEALYTLAFGESVEIELDADTGEVEWEAASDGRPALRAHHAQRLLFLEAFMRKLLLSFAGARAR